MNLNVLIVVNLDVAKWRCATFLYSKHVGNQQLALAQLQLSVFTCQQEVVSCHTANRHNSTELNSSQIEVSFQQARLSNNQLSAISNQQSAISLLSFGLLERSGLRSAIKGNNENNNQRPKARDQRPQLHRLRADY